MSEQAVPKKRMVPVGDHITFEDLPGGTVRASFPPLDLTAEGADRDAAAKAVVGRIQEAIAEPANEERWTAFVEEFSVEVDDDPLPPEVEEALHAVEPITAEEFDAVLDSSDKPVLIDFWAIWCGPCLQMAPELAKVKAELAGKIEVRKLNVDENQELSERLEIKGIPTLVLFEEGGEVARLVGARPAASILQELAPHLPA